MQKNLTFYQRHKQHLKCLRGIQCLIWKKKLGWGVFNWDRDRNTKSKFWRHPAFTLLLHNTATVAVWWSANLRKETLAMAKLTVGMTNFSTTRYKREYEIVFFIFRQTLEFRLYTEYMHFLAWKKTKRKKVHYWYNIAVFI